MLIDPAFAWIPFAAIDLKLNVKEFVGKWYVMASGTDDTLMFPTPNRITTILYCSLNAIAGLFEYIDELTCQ